MAPIASGSLKQKTPAGIVQLTNFRCRIHQSGRLDSISPEVLGQVAEGIRIYKEVLRKHIPESVPFYPIGTSDVTDPTAPLALGMRSPEKTAMAVWRIDGPAITKIPWNGHAKILYPTNPGIKVNTVDGQLTVEFPRPRMGCLVSL